MSARVEIGNDPVGAPITIDLEELLATRLLVQGNSGSGKSHLLRRLLEESAPIVQQIVIDPEGDFVTLAEPFGHIVVDGSAYAGTEITRLAARVRKHRASVVLALDGLEIEAQMRCAAQFLNALFDAPREDWFPALVIVDEAQLFAPAAAGDVTDDTRRLSLAAMTNLMCRGRKRGLAGVIATQRLAKLAKNVAAEASNFLMGRTFLDIDMARAADLLGMERRQAEQIRDLQRGHFLGLGPAISRRPIAVKIGAVRTGSRGISPGLSPPPAATSEELRDLLYADWSADEVVEVERTVAVPVPVPSEVLLDQIETMPAIRDKIPDAEPEDPAETNAAIAEIMMEIAAEEGCTYQTAAALFQDFTIRCRMRRISAPNMDSVQFRRRFAMAIAGIGDPEEERWAEVMRIGRTVPDDLLAPFLVLARAAQEGAPCPDDEILAKAYGTSSSGRIRRLLEHLEKGGLIVLRTDFGGRRSITIPELGLTTAPLETP